MSIAVDRIQNYYQYQDAEKNFYQLHLTKEEKEVVVKEIEEKLPVEVKEIQQENVESKSKKSKKNKKKSATSEVVEKPANIQQEAAKEIAKPSKVIEEQIKSLTKKESQEKDDDTSARTDSGIAETANAKKKSRSKRQREKKAAAAASGVPKEEEQQKEVAVEVEAPKIAEVDVKKNNVAQNTPDTSTPKPKDKKKRNKASSEQKPKDDKNGVPSSSSSAATSTLATEIAKARQHIKNSLERVDGVVSTNLNMPGSELLDRISALEKDNGQLRGLVDGLQNLVISLEGRLKKLEIPTSSAPSSKPTPASVQTKAAADDDDDVDLFGSDDDEDAEAEKLKEERVKAYAEKKSKKPALIAKSSVLLDVKPWDDETDMKELERLVRTIEMDGLVWGASKLVPLAYGIKKLQIMSVIEDDKVSVDELSEKIEAFEDYCQSVDIAAFQKI